MNMKRQLGFDPENRKINTKKFIQYIDLKLAAMGQPYYGKKSDMKFLEIAGDLIANHQEKNRILSNYLCPADKRIQQFINKYLGDLEDKPEVNIPSETFILDHHGIARVLSIPPDADEYVSDIIRTYRLKQGILHNPKNDRRTTKGVFHVAEGGLPIPDDKKAVPKKTFAHMLKEAFNPPAELKKLPFTSTSEKEAEVFVSLLLRPKVLPEVKGVTPEKTMEIRFFAPGNLVSNLDFVESIFGNAGDPYLPRNNASLDAEHWTGTTGCIILAPHLITVKKKDAGLPHISEATERQKRDGMCWEKEDEIYNDGQAFKITARTEDGTIITVIADNYFGYSKKEIKTQISYSANLFGNAEEEHAGGALAFPSYILGEEFCLDEKVKHNHQKFSDIVKVYGSIMDVQPEGYAVDKKFDTIIYIPEDSKMDLNKQTVSWSHLGTKQSIKLLPANTYVLPSGYKVRMVKSAKTPSWRLVGTIAEGTFCHKPSTVSGGGKSEISKSISDSIIYAPFFVADYKTDMKMVKDILARDYGNRFKKIRKNASPSRPILSSERSLGSVIKLLTPSVTDYSKDYNEWLDSIPNYVKGIVFIIKRFYKPEWGSEWEKYFTVNIVDGKPGNELKFGTRKLLSSYLRVGLEKDGSWRTYKLRQDFVAAAKIQQEDDISCSTVIPVDQLENLNPDYKNPSVKIVDNCEYRFFQRPDEAIHRGFDLQAESDLASPNTFISNFEPLTIDDAKELIEDAIGFDSYSDPIKKMIKDFHDEPTHKYFVSSAHPRIVDEKPTKNVRYLQDRGDVINPRERYLAKIGTRFYRKVPLDKPVYFPVNAVLPGRRNNPPEPGIRPLAVYNPIHYQELPELFMDFVCSLTGKSPSTTGAGSEGALTKAPFNAVSPVTDLNNALVSFILTGYAGFSSAAGYIGSNYRVDHDISLLIPEVWCRLSVDERDPEKMIKEGHLEKLEDFEHKGQKILQSRLGYRITRKFVRTYFGRMFENPTSVFSEDMLQPEKQGLDVYVDGINNITEAQERVAAQYFNDGSVEAAIPPLKAILNIMRYGKFEGKTIADKEIRDLFTRENVMKSDWYKDRLMNKQLNDIELLKARVADLEEFLKMGSHLDEAERLGISERLNNTKAELKHVKSAAYLKELEGTIGLDGLYRD